MLSTSLQKDHGGRYYYLLFDGNRCVGDITPIGGHYYLHMFNNDLDYGKYPTNEAALQRANEIYNVTKADAY